MAKFSTLFTRGDRKPKADELAVGGVGIDIQNKRMYSKTSTNEVFEIGKHKDTSSQASISLGGNNFIQSVTVDNDGHITKMTSGLVEHPQVSGMTGTQKGGTDEVVSSISVDKWGHVSSIGFSELSRGYTNFVVTSYNEHNNNSTHKNAFYPNFVSISGMGKLKSISSDGKTVYVDSFGEYSIVWAK